MAVVPFPAVPFRVALATAFLSAGLGLAGCASPGVGDWHRDGASAAQTRGDLRACKRLAEETLIAAGRMPKSTAIDAGANPMANVDAAQGRDELNAMAADCMAQKGYVRVR